MKKLYEIVGIKKIDGYEIGADNSAGEFYSVTLDNVSVKTSGGNLLAVSNRALAELLASEWDEADGKIISENMPINAIICSAIDHVSEKREFYIEQLTGWLDTDLIFYRCPDSFEIDELQQKHWDPFVKWFEEISGTTLKTTYKMSVLHQNNRVASFLSQKLGELDDIMLSALQSATTDCGSVIMALGLISKAFAVEQVFNACFIEENYKSKQYSETEFGKSPQQIAHENKIHKGLNAVAKITDQFQYDVK